jgi:hypothetical protein
MQRSMSNEKRKSDQDSLKDNSVGSIQEKAPSTVDKGGLIPKKEPERNTESKVRARPSSATKDMQRVIFESIEQNRSPRRDKQSERQTQRSDEEVTSAKLSSHQNEIRLKSVQASESSPAEVAQVENGGE